MEKLSRNSSTSFVTPSDLCAIVPRTRSGDDGKTAHFDYRTSAFGDVVRIEWSSASDVALVPVDVAAFLLARGWALDLTEDQATEYNAAVDAFILETTGAPPPPFANPFAGASAAAPGAVSSPNAPRKGR